ncbi:MAG: DUF4919 domain-containing protein [Pseudobacter sp.]|uniref:DUF4919 domain-containing protein n=1 Tax=Pseudobacter sp. TaxID=2045420 RepID=UPI003F7DD159
MKTSIVLVLTFLSLSCLSFAQSVSVPDHKDKYADFVKQLESGNTNINFREFRESLIDSKQFQVAGKAGEKLTRLDKEMKTLMGKEDYEGVIKTTGEILSIDYTILMAHALRSRAFEKNGDTVNLAKYRTILDGLVNSIIDRGDGKTCATGWSVIKVEEEYFILRAMGLQPLGQSVDKNGGICDRIEVQTKEGGTLTYYFNVAKIFEGYNKILGL